MYHIGINMHNISPKNGASIGVKMVLQTTVESFGG